jgi:hypothetical protein
LAQGNIGGIRNKDEEAGYRNIEESVIVRFTKGFKVTKPRGIKIRTKF